MARGVNKVILIGNLGNDPEIRYTPNGNAVANVTLATSSAWRDKKNDNKINEHTEWHRIIFFSRLAEIVGEYLRKGSKIYVEGSLRTRKWQDKNGIDRYTTEIIANEMQMLDKRGASSDGNQGNYNREASGNKDSNYNYNSSMPNGNMQDNMAPAGDFDDDIPF